jgi:hypothetical protein
MRKEGGSVVVFDTPSISILRPKKRIDPNKFKETPAVLGCDFLTQNGFSLYFDPGREIAFLERV